MNHGQANDPELADFLRNVRRGAPPLRSHPCGGTIARSNSLCCTQEQAAELVELAQRPPPGMVLYKFGTRSVVGRYQLADGTPVVLKYYHPKSLQKNLSYGIKGSRCMRSWTAALAFQHLGLPTPPAMLVADWKALGGLWHLKSFLATGMAPGIPLSQWVVDHAADSARLQRIAARLHQCVAIMARHRISHGDLKSTNVIVADDDELYFVDLDGTAISAPGNDWDAARARDQRIFLANWQPGSSAAAAFATVFRDSATDD